LSRRTRVAAVAAAVAAAIVADEILTLVFAPRRRPVVHHGRSAFRWQLAHVLRLFYVCCDVLRQSCDWPSVGAIAFCSQYNLPGNWINLRTVKISQKTLLCVRVFNNDNFSGSGRAIGPACVSVCRNNHTLARTRTVVRKCCKGDDESLCEWKNLTPTTYKPLDQSSLKFAQVIRSGISIALQNLI